MLKIEQLTKKFGNFTAVDHISFEVRAGEIFGFLGPNGAGKTTTIKMITGLAMQDEGSVFVNAIDMLKDPIQAKRQLSYVPDNPDIYQTMTGRQYLNFVSNIYRVSHDQSIATIEELSKLFEIDDALHDSISSYSHGMQQKLCLIGALLPDPNLFVLDEPMVGLDPKSAFHLKEIMRQRCQNGKSVFFSTHVMEVAEKICDRIAIINKGKIIAIGTLDEIRANTRDFGSLEKIFLEITQ